MPLSNLEPKLDDRSFEELYRELRLRSRIYTSEWTNFNDSDPGATLLQLVTWLSEMMLVRMNKIPRKNYVKFLKMLGLELEPAKPAHAYLTFVTKANQAADPVPIRTRVSAQLPDGGPPLVFETMEALDLIQAPLAVIGVSDSGVLRNVTSANQKPGTTFRPLGWFAEVGSALYLGFEKVENLAPFPSQMVFRVFLPAAATAGLPQKSGEVPTPAPVSLVWEYMPREHGEWERLNVFGDGTAAFTKEGDIRVEGPQDIELSPIPLLGADKRYWIRVRLEAGRYPDGQGPEIDFIRPNTIQAENLTTGRRAILGESEGQPGSVFTFPFRPVQPEPLRVITEQNNQAELWFRRDDFLSSGPRDTHFVLNETEGTIRFGNGTSGRIPEAGALVIADEFRYGGGARGNRVGSGLIKSPQTVLPGVDKVTNERAAVGGTDEQSIADLEHVAKNAIRGRGRVVTTGDFESHVRSLGGVANTVALPNTHPEFPGVRVPGAVTVVIVPDTGEIPPRPSIDMVTAVAQSLEPLRLITTEVYVKGPEYREIRVEAFVEARANASFDSLSRAVKQTLDRVLNPKEWPFGEDLYPTDIYRNILDVNDDLVSVKNVNIYVDGRLHNGLGQIALAPGELVFGRNHLVVVTPAINR